MPYKLTMERLIELLEKWFVNDESLPKRKREQAEILVEELWDFSNENTKASSIRAQ